MDRFLPLSITFFNAFLKPTGYSDNEIGGYYRHGPTDDDFRADFLFFYVDRS